MPEQYVSGSFQLLPVPILLISQDGIVLEANKALLELLACATADIVGRPLSEIAGDPFRVAQLHEQTFHIGPVKGRECVLRDRDGHQIPASISTMPRRNEMGIISGYYAVALDLRPVRQKDESLRIPEPRCREIAEHADEWVWEVNAQGQFTYASPTVEKLLGYAPVDLVGRKRLRDLVAALGAQSDSETDEPTPRELILKAFADAKPFHNLLTPEFRKDGRVLWLSLSGEPVLSDLGEFAGFRGVAKDFSARLAASGSLDRPNQEFEMRNSKLESELNAVRKSAESAQTAAANSLRAVEERLKELRDQNSKLKTDNTMLEQARKQVEQAMQNLRLTAESERASLTESLRVAEERVAELRARASELETRNTKLEQTRKQAEQAMRRRDEELGQVQEAGRTVEDRLAQAIRAREQAETALRTTSGQLRRTEAALQDAEAHRKEEAAARARAEEALREVRQAAQTAAARLAQEKAARKQAEDALIDANMRQSPHLSRAEDQPVRETAAREKTGRKLQEAAAQNSELETRTSELETGGTDALRLAEDRLRQEITARQLTEQALRHDEQQLQKLRDALSRIHETLPVVERRLAREISAREQAGQALRETREELEQTQQILQEMEGTLAKETAARHGAEEALRRKEEVLAMLRETMAARDQAESAQPPTVVTPSPMLLVLDREGRFTSQHPADSPLEQLNSEALGLCFPAGGILRRKYTEALPAHVSPLMARAIERNQHQEPAEYEYPVANGKLVWWFRAYLTPIVLNREYAGSFVEIRDISERKQREKEQELKRLNLELRQRVTDLQAAMRQLEAFSRDVAAETRGLGDMTRAKRAAGATASVSDPVPGTAPAERESPAPSFPLLSPGDYIAAIPADTLQQLAHARRKVQDTRRLIEHLLAPVRAEESSPAPEPPAEKPD